MPLSKRQIFNRTQKRLQKCGMLNFNVKEMLNFVQWEILLKDWKENRLKYMKYVEPEE